MEYDLTFYEENGWATIRELNKHRNYKSTINKIYRNRYSKKDCIGECVNLYETLQPISVQDFRDKLEAYTEEHQDLILRHRGPTNIELFEAAQKFREECCAARPSLRQYDIMFFYNNLLHHQTTETFYGCKKEERLCEYLKLNNIEYRHSTSDEDGEFCADIFTFDDNGKENSAIQIKPISFIIGGREDIQMDRNKLLPAMTLLKNKMGIDLIFVVYNVETNKWLKNTKDNSFTFQFNELFDIIGGNVVAKECYNYKNIDNCIWDDLPN